MSVPIFPVYEPINGESRTHEHPELKLQDAERAAGVTPVNFAFPPGDVRRYGADPTGVADSYPAIATAMSIFSSSGVVPFFPRGTYKLSAAVTIPQNLICDLGAAFFKPTGSAGCFVLSSVTWLMGGFIDMTSSSGVAISGSGDLQQLVLMNLHIICGSGTGIELTDCYGVDAYNIRLDSGSGRAIYIKTSIVGGTLTNSQRWTGVSTSGFTSATDIITLEGVAGIIIRELDTENNASGATDILITSNAVSSTVNVLIDGIYAETGPSLTGNIIKIDKGAGSFVGGVKLTRLYTLTSKQPVLVSGTGISDDLEITGSAFQSGTGSPTYAVSVPAGYIPNCHSNTGSQQDLNRAFTPTLLFGGAAVGMTGAFTGRYQRIANRITGEFQVTLTAKGSSTGFVTVGSLPKAAYSLSTNNAAGVNFCGSMAALTQVPVGRIGASGTTIALSHSNALGSVDMSDVNFTNTSIVYGWFSYEVEG